MVPRSLFLPINKGMLHRPRIDTLLGEGANTPCTALTAGPGYGKTFAVAKFAEQYPGRLAWLQLQKLNNLPHHFWQSLMQAARLEAPTFAGRFEPSGFPSSPSAFDELFRDAQALLPEGERFLLVADDFHLLTSRDVLHFFSRVIAAQLPGVSLILCGVTPGQLELLARKSAPPPFTITMDALCFSRGEIASLLSMHGAEASPENIEAIWQHTEGWPLAANLLATQLRFDPDAVDASRWLELSLTESLFERDFYAAYPADIRSLLLKLSLLPKFTRSTISAAAGCGPGHLDGVLPSHPFIIRDKSGGTYTFQHMYRQFLAERAAVLEKPERRRVLSLAADECLQRGEKLEALELLAGAGRYREMLVHIAGFTNSGMPRQLAAHLHGLLLALPDGIPETEPLAEYLKAIILLNNMELPAAERLLKQLAARFEAGQAADPSSEAVGEVYLSLAAVRLIQNSGDFLEYYRKAAGVFYAGSRLKEQNQRFVGNNRVFFIERQTPGEVERIEKAYHEAEPYIVQVMNGGGLGVAELFSAEAAYQTGRFEDAKRHAEAAIQKASGSQHDIAFNARLVLAMAAMHTGALLEAVAPIAAIRADIAAAGLEDLHELRDTAEGWFFIKMGDLARVAPWMAGGESAWKHRPPIDIGRERVLYANYLVRKQDFHGLMEFLTPLEQVFRMRGHWIERLTVYILRAVGHLNTGNEHMALQSLWRAYEMSHQNGITSPFAEGAWYMRILVDVARKSDAFAFPAAWLDDIYERATLYMQNLGGLMEQYRRIRRQPLPARGAPLPEARLLQALGGASKKTPTPYKQFSPATKYNK